MSKFKDQMIANYRSQVKLVLDNINKIEQHSSTKIIKYPTFKDSFDYVDVLFPGCDVKLATIYQTSYKYLKKLGYGSAEGFYSKLNKIIVICDKTGYEEKQSNDIWSTIKAKITGDEVIVHELLHYCSDRQENCNSSVNIEEEFAYGNSIGYLLKKGYSEDEIIANNFLPYLVNTIDRKVVIYKVLNKVNLDVDEFKKMSPVKQKNVFKKYEKKLLEESVIAAKERGHDLIRIYCKQPSAIIAETQGLSYIDLDL